MKKIVLNSILILGIIAAVILFSISIDRFIKEQVLNSVIFMAICILIIIINRPKKIGANIQKIRNSNKDGSLCLIIIIFSLILLTILLLAGINSFNRNEVGITFFILSLAIIVIILIHPTKTMTLAYKYFMERPNLKSETTIFSHYLDNINIDEITDENERCKYEISKTMLEIQQNLEDKEFIISQVTNALNKHKKQLAEIIRVIGLIKEKINDQLLMDRYNEIFEKTQLIKSDFLTEGEEFINFRNSYKQSVNNFNVFKSNLNLVGINKIDTLDTLNTKVRTFNEKIILNELDKKYNKYIDTNIYEGISLELQELINDIKNYNQT